MSGAKALGERVYIKAVAIIGLAIMFLNIPRVSSIGTAIELLYMTLLVVLGEASPIWMPGRAGTVSVSLPVAYTVAVLYGPQAGIWVAALGTLRKVDLQGKTPFWVVLFNRAMIATSMFFFCNAYSALGGRYGGLDFPSGLLAFIVAACVYTLTNALVITFAIALQSKMSIIGAWKVHIVWGLPSIMAIIPVAAVMILAAQQGGPWFLILFYAPLMVSRYSLAKYEEMRSAYHEMAKVLSNAIDARDSYTSGHSERVSEYAKGLAREMQLSEDKVELLGFIGLLHDVGKVGIRDAVMKKPGRYTFEEYEEMKSHSRIGADMLEGNRFLGEGRDWVRHHHERWDGSGFPDGLAGKEIPLEARILACADSFDAMTTDRPYKSRMDLAEAKQELLRCSGTQFDPEVVKAMLRVIDGMASNKALNKDAKCS